MQFLVESAMMSGIGGLIGLLLAITSMAILGHTCRCPSPSVVGAGYSDFGIDAGRRVLRALPSEPRGTPRSDHRAAIRERI
jgi:hypothetical protein